MTFALIAYVLLTGEPHAYVLDSALTYEDCMDAVSIGALAVEFTDGTRVDLDGAPLVCELERG